MCVTCDCVCAHEWMRNSCVSQHTVEQVNANETSRVPRIRITDKRKRFRSVTACLIFGMKRSESIRLNRKDENISSRRIFCCFFSVGVNFKWKSIFDDRRKWSDCFIRKRLSRHQHMACGRRWVCWRRRMSRPFLLIHTMNWRRCFVSFHTMCYGSVTHCDNVLTSEWRGNRMQAQQTMRHCDSRFILFLVQFRRTQSSSTIRMIHKNSKNLVEIINGKKRSHVQRWFEFCHEISNRSISNPIQNKNLIFTIFSVPLLQSQMLF